MKDQELELQIAQFSLQEAEEAFTQLRDDYRALREHADSLEVLLRNSGIDFPEFCG